MRDPQLDAELRRRDVGDEEHRHEQRDAQALSGSGEALKAIAQSNRR
jgi:hypothetical protein